MGYLFEQSRPSTTNNEVIFSSKNRFCEIDIIACNTTAGAITYSIYITNKSLPGDENTILIDSSLAAKGTVKTESLLIPPNYRIIAKVSTGATISFTVQGVEKR